MGGGAGRAQRALEPGEAQGMLETATRTLIREVAKGGPAEVSPRRARGTAVEEMQLER